VISLLERDNKENNSTLSNMVKLLRLKNNKVMLFIVVFKSVGKDEVVFKYKSGDYFGELALLKD
jgi:CRP-like cAMP-binding protein